MEFLNQSGTTRFWCWAVFLALLILLVVPGLLMADPQSLTDLQSLAHADQVKLPEITSKMLSYSRVKYALYFVWMFYQSVALLIVLATGGSARIRDLARRIRQPFMQILVYYLLFSLLMLAMDLPLMYFGGYALDHWYGLSAEPLTRWLSDLGKAQLIEVVIAAPCLFVVFWVIARFPRRWSIVLWLAFIPFAAAAIFLEPLIIEPVFNKVQMMPAGPLRQNIDRLAQAAGLACAPVFVVDKSKQTQKINAYVTGIGSSARVVIWDNTINLLPADQVLAVVGHELGHYALGHIYWGLLMIIGGQLVILLVAQKYAAAFIAWLPASWKLQGLNDMAIIPVIMLVSTLFFFVADPLINAISRFQEHQADAYGLKLTGNGPAMARCFVSLAEQNLSEPDPPKWIELWLFSHPTLKDRIEFALRN